MEFLASKGAKDDKFMFMRTLKEVEKNFSFIVDMEALFNPAIKNTISPSHSLMDIVNTTMNAENVDKAMSKFRESIRILRANRLSVFSDLSNIEKLLEAHKDDTIIKMLGHLTEFAEKMVNISP